MVVYVAKILIEDIDMNTCSVKVFDSVMAAREFANEEINRYEIEYNGYVTDRTNDYYSMQAGDAYVTIEIEACTIN